MSRWSASRSVLGILAVALVAGACATAGPSGSVAPSAPLPTELPTAPVATPSAAASRSATDPPDATVSVEGGDPVTGQLGSYLWGDGGSDSPWLPGSPITVGSGEHLAVTIADGVGVATWSARRVQAGTADGSGAVGLGTGGPPITFEAPPAGSWSVQVTVDFDDGLGSATYYWLVTVR